ncbi:lipoyl domain-containing protein [Actinomadura macra]|uniref:lipoyl domain-containing protein n=1 Tax=Actinomadura macra TaxID=46164 RepID=UPI00082D9D79|nr:lipoyl domain-containing protein [Actinomadura macra]
MTDITVPMWGMTMEDAVLIAWLKNVGDRVEQDEPVAEIETDKASGEIVSPETGTLAEILVQPDEEVKPGQVVGRLETDAAG